MKTQASQKKKMASTGMTPGEFVLGMLSNRYVVLHRGNKGGICVYDRTLGKSARKNLPTFTEANQICARRNERWKARLKKNP